jgi:hypothetical protein
VPTEASDLVAPSGAVAELDHESASNEDRMVNRSLARTRQVYLIVPVATGPRQRTLQS